MSFDIERATIPLELHSFPTRRSSDLDRRPRDREHRGPGSPHPRRRRSSRPEGRLADGEDRKSTRLNSSHGYISYAVFCLKKKKQAAHAREYARGFTTSDISGRSSTAD